MNRQKYSVIVERVRRHHVTDFQQAKDLARAHLIYLARNKGHAARQFDNLYIQTLPFAIEVRGTTNIYCREGDMTTPEDIFVYRDSYSVLGWPIAYAIFWLAFFAAGLAGILRHMNSTEWMAPVFSFYIVIGATLTGIQGWLWYKTIIAGWPESYINPYAV